MANVRTSLKAVLRALERLDSMEATIYHKKASGDLSGLLRVSERRFDEVFEEWFKTYQNTVERTTSVRTDDLFRIHILPVLGKMKISKITPWQCQDFITEKGQTFRNIKQVKSYTSQVFDFALKMKWITDNPNEANDTPKKRAEEVR